MSWRAVARVVAIAVALAASLVVVAIAVALAASLALRRGDGDPDLKQELAELSKDLRGRVAPLPQVKAAVPAAYRAGDLPDPFYPAEKKKR